MPAFQPFVMERMMSKWENVVDYNLSESGVHPLTLRELLALAPDDEASLLDTELKYEQANGSPALRAAVAALYPGAGPEDVLITVGAAEANFLALETLLTPGDRIAVMLPNYMQVWGIARNMGLEIAPIPLAEEDGWALEAAALDAAVTPATKMIAVCNPNNPTGRVLTEAEMAAVVAAAERVGAWLLADEVYRGAERVGEAETPSFHGRYDRVVAIGGLSKAYGLPGLRIGWAVTSAETADAMWMRHEYTTISATTLANRLAALALSPAVRPRLLDRTRSYIREGYPVLEGWLDSHGNSFSLVPPQAAAIAFVRYHLEVNSTVLMERLRDEKSVLLVPGDQFGLDRYLRINFGLPHDFLNAALDRVHALLLELGE